LQPRLNSELKNSASGKRKGMLGTALIHLMLFGMLILVGFSTPPAPESEEGILVNFGTGETGIGDIEPSPPAFREESKAPPVKEVKLAPASAKSAAKTKEDPLLTQNTEEAPAVKKPDLKLQRKSWRELKLIKRLKSSWMLIESRETGN